MLRLPEIEPVNKLHRVLTEDVFDDGVVSDWQTLSLDLGVATFVDQIADRLHARITWTVELIEVQLQVDLPHAMNGSAMRSIWMVALFNLTNTPLLIWRKRRSWRILRGVGALNNENKWWNGGEMVYILLIPRMRTTKASLASSGTK